MVSNTWGCRCVGNHLVSWSGNLSYKFLESRRKILVVIWCVATMGCSLRTCDCGGEA